MIYKIESTLFAEFVFVSGALCEKIFGAAHVFDTFGGD